MATAALLAACASTRAGNAVVGPIETGPTPFASAASSAAALATPTPAPAVETPQSTSETPSPVHSDGESGAGVSLKPTGPTQVAQVVSITDGDTIRVQFGGREYPVRYIGMDTPETHFGVEPLGPEAADANARLVAGRQVVLEKDVSETDKYGRLLRYVWLRDDSGWLLVNLELVRLGFAQVATYPPDVKYTDSLLLPAQRAARAAGIGLWASGEPTSSATPAATAPHGLVGGSCEPSYPDICVPLDSPDLDCGDISARRFRVVWDVPNPDPDRFDGDHDGIGCEG
jgi:micrococcal nuclease